MGVNVDEPRRDGHAVRVNLDRTVVLQIPANRDDATAVDRDVRLDPAAAKPIEYGATANHECITPAPGQYQPRRARQRGQRRPSTHYE